MRGTQRNTMTPTYDLKKLIKFMSTKNNKQLFDDSFKSLESKGIGIDYDTFLNTLIECDREIENARETSIKAKRIITETQNIYTDWKGKTPTLKESVCQDELQLIENNLYDLKKTL